MARPLEFNKQEVLDAATDLIWAQGYNGASLAELVEAMGLNKSSFYNSFGSKEDVLRAAIDIYSAAQVRMLERLFAKSGFREGLSALSASVIKDNNDGRGCLLVNCAAELALQEPRAVKHVREGFDAIAGVFAAQAQAAQARGELDPAVDPRSLAQSLVAFISGLRILVKSGMDRGALTLAARDTLGRLVPGPP
jgi:TetR/AcrR family transcriptional regulator, transcriptional repressor for nem operon